MELSTTDVIEVEKYLREHKGLTFVFAPRDCGDSPHQDYSKQDYLDWLHKLYPDSVFKYTNSMGSNGIQAKITEYLKVKWQFREVSEGVIRHNLILLKKERILLNKIKQTFVCFRQAQREMNELRI